MSSLDSLVQSSIPENLNPLYPDRFKFSIRKLPKLSFFCTEANIPGVSVKVLEISNPFNVVKVGGNKVVFNDLMVTFKVDEDLQNWREIYNWVKGIGAPENWDQFKNLIQSNPIRNSNDDYNIYSDATLVTLKNSMNLNFTITYVDVFPTSLSDIKFTYTDSSTVLTAEATFAYLNFNFDT